MKKYLLFRIFENVNIIFNTHKNIFLRKMLHFNFMNLYFI